MKPPRIVTARPPSRRPDPKPDATKPKSKPAATIVVSRPRGKRAPIDDEEVIDPEADAAAKAFLKRMIRPRE